MHTHREIKPAHRRLLATALNYLRHVYPLPLSLLRGGDLWWQFASAREAARQGAVLALRLQAECKWLVE